MLAISTLTVDPYGAQLLTFKPGQVNLGDTARRLSRVATLDGGATVLDGGYTLADKTIRLDLSSQSREVVDALRYLCAMYTKLLVLTEEGAFSAAPERVSISGQSISMTLLVTGAAEIKL